MNPVAQKLCGLLKEKNLTVATAESCTGGLISKLITDIPGSSGVFHCGIVSYSNDIKSKILGVKNETLRSFGAVSAQTVEEMAAGVKALAESDCAIAVSGIAGPDSDGTEKTVGTIWICCICGDTVKTVCLHNNFTENVRDSNRNTAANEAMRLLINMLTDGNVL